MASDHSPAGDLIWASIRDPKFRVLCDCPFRDDEGDPHFVVAHYRDVDVEDKPFIDSSQGIALKVMKEIYSRAEEVRCLIST